ncbi:alpha/beta hydrolase-fold protein [Aquidulcibacter sp.]|uniref:alpha/beta hydrolase n=1 Tax=Aquidulcibacter sp. TaxID=2052990 RepID=UPI0025B85564|nr:alpha/beta hydrolase-fold protein [Aquidulcibacter sp.]MCA3692265.1 alpha/beta hydrolase [Aquidulcibacter sp.]
MIGSSLAACLAVPSIARSQATETTRSANVTILDEAMAMPSLGRKRRIWIYLPPDYQASRRRYRVIYMQDGQNLFDRTTSYAGEWQVDETLNRLAASGDPGAIVVGIDNGGRNRTAEYHPRLPWSGLPGQADAYLSFLIDTLKPIIDRRFRTLARPASTLIMGSSSGATLALYAGIMRPDVFGRVGAFSTPLWLEPRLDQLARSQKPYRPGARVFLVSGRDERVGDEPKGIFAKDQPAMVEALVAVGYRPDRDIRSRIVDDGTHSEGFWAREFEGAYRFLTTS